MLPRKKLDRFLAFLAYSIRISRQLTSLNNLPHFYLIFYGFTPNKGSLYDFKTYGYKNYVSDVKRYLNNTFINYNYKDLLRDKYGLYIFLNQFSDNLVPILGLIDKGRCHFLDSSKDFSRIFKNGEKFVMKPRKSWGGRGVCIVEIKDGQYYRNNKKVDEFEQLFKGFDDYFIVPFVYQHDYAEKINPQALNTIRLITCVWKDEVRIIGACHRFGSRTTGYVDNFSKGGISAKVDIESGVMVSAYAFDPEKYKKYQAAVHPDTRAQIVGLEIPHWHIMLEKIVQLHESIKFIKYIAWDIAITAADFSIIEANDVSDVDGFQIHGPLLVNELNRSFYAAT